MLESDGHCSSEEVMLHPVTLSFEVERNLSYWYKEIPTMMANVIVPATLVCL